MPGCSPAHAEAAVAAAAPRLVLAQLETPAAATRAGFAAARGRGALTVLNAAPAAPALPPWLGALVDLLLVNAGEARLLGDDLPGLAATHRLGVVVTEGAAGALHAAPDGTVTHDPAFPITVREDDAFAGSLAARPADGAPPPRGDAARAGRRGAGLHTRRRRAGAASRRRDCGTGERFGDAIACAAACGTQGRTPRMIARRQLLAGSAMLPVAAQAQSAADCPTRPVRIICPFPPGQAPTS